MPSAIMASILDWATMPLAFLVVLTAVVFVHELGHFLVARWCGVAVKEFSIGFGREVSGFTDAKGTRWKLGWLPLGGYVKFMDDMSAASQPSPETLAKMTPAERAGSFQLKPVWKRAAVVAAGPIANFLFAIAIFGAFAYFYGVRSTEARVHEVVTGGPAAEAGIQAGDLIVAIDKQPIKSFSDLQEIVTLSSGRELTVTLDRQGTNLDVKLAPKKMMRKDPIGGEAEEWMIGIKQLPTASMVKFEELGVGGAVAEGVDQTLFIIRATAGYIRDVILGRKRADQLGGPARIADISGKVAKLGPEFLVHLIAVLSVSIGLVNLLPIPPLDGGHLMFYAAEAVRRRPLSATAQDVGFRIGLAVVLSLMVFGFYNDRTIIKGWFSWMF